ncbi:MAG: serine/threonine protein kinase [Candidatus Aminicenantes bacterium]|nr:serine/threonine protein kinase [Candidatus Aminicenantes bacterium]MDH5384296.1 serine/threonine protein kinase [Candidatus Aminicenantes bacterium]MDH5742859.1 serine/threonine protein kinase [Candidatus Aminicenantes bacterium]
MVEDSLVSKTIKHYQVDELVGRGGMGVVYRARDTKLNRPVAIKVLKPDLTANPDRLQRFIQEARSAAAVTHPSIAQVYEIDTVDEMTFIVMEFVEGQTVGHLIAKKELDLIGSVEITLQVAEGLSKAHKSNIIHRDIKSDNIMVTHDGHAKLLDFGLAKLLEPSSDAEKTLTLLEHAPTKTMPQTTAAGTIMGTTSYMSPEQARGQTLSYPSDIFSLGIVLYEMVTGELPFEGDSPLDTMHAIAFEEARPVTVIRKNLPPELHRIIARCLRKRPEDRYPDAGELAADLKRLKADIESGVRRPFSPAQKIDELKYWAMTSLPVGPQGIMIVALILVVAAILIFTDIQWANLLWIGILGLLLFRYIKNRKKRMLKRFISQVSKIKAVRAIRIKEDSITVIVDKAQASQYIRINSLVDEINRKLYFGRHIEVAVRDDLPEEEFQHMLRETGIAFVRDDVILR